MTWEAIPTEELARQLTAGAGGAPMAEMGVAYTALATGLNGAAAELRAILALMGQAWSSQHSDDSLAGVGGLAEWIEDAADAAHSNADVAVAQAAGYATASAAMPRLGDIRTALETMRHMLAGGLLGAPLVGLVGTVDQQLDALRRQAAQTMRNYEAASAGLAHPWYQKSPPSVSDAAAFEGEHPQGAPRPAQPVQWYPDTSVHVPSPQHVPVTQSVYPGDVLVAGPVVAAAVPVPGPPVAVASTVVVPPPVAPVQPVDDPPLYAPATEPVAPRAASAAAPDDPGACVNAGFATAPAVLGAAVPAPARRQVPGQGVR